VLLLQARLSAEYFDVVTATNGFEALAICERERGGYRVARRDDARHGRLRSLPPSEEQLRRTRCISPWSWSPRSTRPRDKLKGLDSAAPTIS
jgi:two-component system cell cycle response regulator